MLLAYRRWVGLPNKTPKSRPPGPVRARSIYAQQREAASSNVDDLLSPAISLKENLPYEVPAPKETRDNPLAIDSTPPITGHEPDGPGPQTVRPANYLLVDDNSINLRVLSAFIKKLGGRFELASNGQEALDAYIQRASIFTAILMDISMPIMNGLEATRRIRAHEHREHLQPATIIALTGLASDSTQQEALESGVDEFLTKPVTLKMLSKAFEQMGL
jgi:CheY-like chemotaxis protein